jgi:hypothetical protein
MIFFVPTYDEQTRANFQVIQNALPTEGVHLIAQNALRANLLHHLTQNDVLFVMSHGKNDCFYDHSDSPALQVSDEFTRKSVFIFAC